MVRSQVNFCFYGYAQLLLSFDLFRLAFAFVIAPSMVLVQGVLQRNCESIGDSIAMNSFS